MVKTMELSPGVFLRCFWDGRFKQSCISIQLVRPMCRDEAALNALLPAVLLRGTESCPDMRAITLRLDDLYGASVGAMVRRVGDYQTTGLYCGFLQDAYSLEGDSVLAPTVDFLGQLLLSPRLEGGGFVPSYVEGEKTNLLSAIDAQRNDKRLYCVNQLMRRMCAADPFGIPRLGEREDVAAITPEALFAHYRRILRISRMEIFYVGAAEPETVAARFSQALAGVSRAYEPLPPQTPFRDGGGGEYTETMQVAQGKLAMGFVSPITLSDPGFAAMQVCNTLFGGGMTSKLFLNVRERMSLCYDISSGYRGAKGLMTVAAGIDCGQAPTVRQEVLNQLAACAAGDITEEELSAAKQALSTGLRAVHDTPGAIENYYATAALSGLGMTPEAYQAAVEAVTAADVAQAAGTLRLHSVYLLKGV